MNRHIKIFQTSPIRIYPQWGIALLIVLTGSQLVPWCFAGEEAAATSILMMERPINIGHRGYKAFAPENTMPGLEIAANAGCDLIEFDVHFSSDRQPVVIHDRTLDRTTDACALWGAPDTEVKSRSASEISLLDAGSWFHPRYNGTKVPLLAEVLTYLHGKGTVALIDRKAGTAEEFISLLRKLDLLNAVIIQAFDWDFLGEVHEKEENLILSAAGPARTWKGQRLSQEERELNKSWIDEAKRNGASALAWNDQVSREAVDYAHKQDMRVWVYTINNEQEARALLDLGVDGIITDNPAIIWKACYLHSMGQLPGM